MYRRRGSGGKPALMKFGYLTQVSALKCAAVFICELLICDWVLVLTLFNSGLYSFD
jgi:hypothetical protein